MNEMTATIHETRALEISKDRTQEILDVATCARQGDVLCRRVSDSKGSLQTTPAVGVLVGRGRHGEHRLMVNQARIIDGDVITVAFDKPALLVHTDLPEGRHKTMRLSPGTWEFMAQQELGLDLVIREVAD